MRGKADSQTYSVKDIDFSCSDERLCVCLCVRVIVTNPPDLLRLSHVLISILLTAYRS